MLQLINIGQGPPIVWSHGFPAFLSWKIHECEVEKNTMCYDGAALKSVLRYIHFCKKYEFVFFEWLPIAFVSFMSDVEKLKTSFFLLT